MSDWRRLAALSDLPETGSVAVAVDGLSVLLVRSPAGLFAIENRCTHALQELAGGRVRGFHIFCPAHGVRFDLRTGCPSGDLTRDPVRIFPVKAEGEDVLVDLGP
jgi:3-phenylpropionate/trans-cinnamate dioxygenase ferredoxin subunit